MIKKANSLRTTRHIKRAFDRGVFYRGGVFAARAFFSGDTKNPARLAVIASKKFSKRAVDRNLIRRQIKAAFRPIFPELAGWDVAILPNIRIKSEKFETISEEVAKCLDFLRSKSSGFTRQR